jgi:hypothetical protein
MTETTLEQTIADDLMLSPIKPLKPLAQWAAEQGKQPINYEELRKLGEFFPEEESVDELIAFIRESRRDRDSRELEP